MPTLEIDERKGTFMTQTVDFTLAVGLATSRRGLPHSQAQLPPQPSPMAASAPAAEQAR